MNGRRARCKALRGGPLGLGALLVGTVVGGLVIGCFVDRAAGTSPVFVLVGIALGIVAGAVGLLPRPRGAAVTESHPMSQPLADRRAADEQHDAPDAVPQPPRPRREGRLGRVLRNQRGPSCSALGLVVAASGSSASSASGASRLHRHGIALGLVNHLPTEHCLQKVISSGDPVTRAR